MCDASGLALMTPPPTPLPTATATPDQAVSIDSSAVDQASFPGPCPHYFNFDAYVSSHYSVTIRFRWEHSGGYIGPEINWSFTGVETQILGTVLKFFSDFSWWAWLHILSPDDLTSEEVYLSLTCP
jgi:hypothetical protein